jgi:hypothetical protein
MPRLIPPIMGNGKRPSDPDHGPGTVPVLDVSDETHDLVGDLHDRALDPEDDEAGLLTGARVRIDNSSVANAPAGTADVTQYVIGGSTLHEAATEIIGTFGDHGNNMPSWVASTDSLLAEVLAEHFTLTGYNTCQVFDMGDTTL